MADEARAMLDQLMGGDRNAPIPKGAALPRRNTKHKSSHSSHPTTTTPPTSMHLPGVRKRSCYDRDICPLYCAWGIDVYELFKNTKSDLGPNSFLTDDDARDEFRSLPPNERDRLGYEYMLYRKLQELVRSCDRTVARNKEKLRAEIQRKGVGGSNDPVMNVDEEMVERVARYQAQLEDLEGEIEELVRKLDELEREEEEEEPVPSSPLVVPPEKLQKLHTLTTALCQKVSATQPLMEQLEASKRSLYFFRSDTSTDKTVCEVSGNFMSSRDADERIAAHYAGKQYVGWKAVREKYAELHKLYGPGGRGVVPQMSSGMHPPKRMEWESSSSRPPPPPLRERSRERERRRSREREKEREMERDWRRGRRSASPPSKYRSGSGRDSSKRDYPSSSSRGYEKSDYDRYGSRSRGDRRDRRR